MYFYSHLKSRIHIAKRAFKEKESRTTRLCLPPSTLLPLSSSQKADAVTGLTTPLVRLWVAVLQCGLFLGCTFLQQVWKCCPLMFRIGDGKHPLPYVCHGKVRHCHSLHRQLCLPEYWPHSVLSFLWSSLPKSGPGVVVLVPLGLVNGSLSSSLANICRFTAVFAFTVDSLKNKGLGRNMWYDESARRGVADLAVLCPVVSECWPV